MMVPVSAHNRSTTGQDAAMSENVVQANFHKRRRTTRAENGEVRLRVSSSKRVEGARFNAILAALTADLGGPGN